MTIDQAVKTAKRICVYFACANGARIEFSVTKQQVREMVGQSSLGEVFTHTDNDEDHDPTARWSLSGETLHLHFLT